MTQNIHHFSHQCQKRGVAIALTILGVGFAWGENTSAQIIPDATLPNNSTVTPFGPINTINGGTRAGDNLFHSFSEFSLPAFNVAFFNNAFDIANIFSRVTGGNPSNLDGILFTNGTANLFFLNPNGIIFGPNAQLNVGGSFISTTANAIGFGSQGTFDATVPNNPSLLTIQPSFFQYDRAATQPANSIEVRGKLSVSSGNSILLVGGSGSILVDGTINSNPLDGFISAPNGKIAIGGLSAPGRIGLARDVNNPGLMSLIFPQGVEQSDVSLVNRATLDVRGNTGGAVAISARQLNVKDSVIVSLNNNAGVPGVKVGDITLNATDAVLEGSDLVNAVGPLSTGDGGNINIVAQRLNMTGDNQIVAATYGRGNAGNIAINVSENLNLNGQNRNGSGNVITSAAAGGSEGNGGNVEITAGSLNITDGTQVGAVTVGRGNAGNIEITTGTLDVTKGAAIDASTGGQGDGGNITVTARGRINLDGETSFGASGIRSRVLPGGAGNAGNVEIATGTLNITNGAAIDASTGRQGDAGNITVTARERINLDGEGSLGASAIGSAVLPGAEGNAGSVEIATGTLNITNGAGITALTGGRGNAGNVRVAARESINLDGEGRFSVSQIGSTAIAGAVGNGGNVEITTGTLNITNGAGIGATTVGQGNAGNVRIAARERISLDGEGIYSPSAISSQVTPGAVGNGGTLDLTTPSFSLTNGAQISVSTAGQGNAGTVRIVASDRIDLDGQGKLGASGINSALLPGGVGNGGNIDLTTGTLNLTNGAQVVTSTVGRGNAGNIAIAASNEINVDGQPLRAPGPIPSLIASSVLLGAVGNGGNIDLDTGRLKITNGGQISAETAGQGDGGNITIAARDRITVDGYGLDGSGIATSVNSGAVGNGGDISLAAPSVNITNRGFVSADNLGVGDAGDIAQIAARTLYLDNGSITTQSFSGNGGNISNLQVQDLLLMRNGSRISTTAGTQQSGGGNGGNMNINAGFAVAIPRENSDITANAFAGNGGNINISAQGIFGFSVQQFLTPRSDITASSQLGINGTINIFTLGIDPNRGLVPAPLTPGAPNLPQSCQANAREGGSRFIESDRGGLPPNPQEALGSGSLWSDARSEPAANLTPNPAPARRNEISEAQGWVKGENGTVVFIGSAPTSSPGAIAGCSGRYNHPYPL